MHKILAPESIIGIAAGVCTTVSALPQLIKALKTKQVEGLSPVMFSILLVGLSLWVAYGFLRNDLPIIITNGTSVLLNGVVLVLYFMYREKTGKT